MPEENEKVGVLDRLRNLLPANRVAAITGVLTGIGAFVASVQTNFVPDGSPSSEPVAKAVAAVGALILVLKSVDKFLEGQINWDTLEQNSIDAYESVLQAQGDTPVPPEFEPAPEDLPSPEGDQTKYTQ